MTQLQALSLSIALEVPCLLALARATGWSDASATRLAGVGALATLLTHPFVWIGTPAMRPWIGDWWIRVAITETGACLVEAVVYAVLLAMPMRRAGAVSVAANTVSFGVGLAWFFWLRDLFG